MKSSAKQLIESTWLHLKHTRVEFSKP